MTAPAISWARPSTTTTRIACIWLASRAAVFIAAFVGSMRTLLTWGDFSAYVQLWSRWDTVWFDSIARQGYVAPYSALLNKDFHYNVAFFPGFPLLMRLVAAPGIGTTAAGLLISLVAGFAAALALGRLSAQVGALSEYGVLVWVAAPTAIFLAAAYTEALFCAFAFWAWSLGREQRWLLAGLLAGGAAFVRINGIFLGIGLIVMFLASRSRHWWQASALLLPFAVTAGYFGYLRAITGQWDAWTQAQSIYWKRSTTDPWTSLSNTFHRIFNTTGPSSAVAPERFMLEIVAMAVIIAIVVVALRWRWWAEASYLAVTAISLGTSTVYLSVPRTLVVLFPIWMVLAVVMTRHRWFRFGYLAIMLPALCYWTVRFTQGFWVS